MVDEVTAGPPDRPDQLDHVDHAGQQDPRRQDHPDCLGRQDLLDHQDMSAFPAILVQQVIFSTSIYKHMSRPLYWVDQ